MNDTAVAIVLAAGSGRRMGGGLPKQYLPLAGRPLLWHTLAALAQSPQVEALILALRPEDQALAAGLTANFPKVRCLVSGGQERADSVRAALAATIPADELVLIHDAVRPFVSAALIGRVIAAAKERGAAVPALPARETIKVVEEGQIIETPPRARLWAAQTPQGFRRSLLLEACARPAGRAPATDEAMLVEELGHPVQVVEGEAANLKITTPEDLAWAGWWLEQRAGGAMDSRSVRVGQGYDVHRLEADRALVLGGVDIPFERGLAGHSDADVLLHAVMDALLGAAGLGDIGGLFPNTDPRFLGVSSLVLLAEVGERLRQAQARIINIDATLLAQRPRISPHVPQMIIRMATALQVEPERLSIKATTNEGLGFVGREEGIAAHAVALVET
ncbi:MAG: 2-C-methyl-D-erythritol 4-phosphate cytidylyltransferase [Candidatus Handelsmanbacteria bacterium]|nr:2-C-methyl-D-erythritol 4-phosphate cytidylyltransferase [Candidatus Handelsmanbacteria bacterium]